MDQKRPWGKKPAHRQGATLPGTIEKEAPSLPRIKLPVEMSPRWAGRTGVADAVGRTWDQAALFLFIPSLGGSGVW